MVMKINGMLFIWDRSKEESICTYPFHECVRTESRPLHQSLSAWPVGEPISAQLCVG